MKKVFEVITIFLTILAIFSASTASWVFFYQPKAPKSINKIYY